MNRFYASPDPANPKLLRYACWLLYQDLKRRDTQNLLGRISATVNPASGYAFEFEGRTISWDLLISLDSLYSIAEVDPRVLSERVLVADIGAGWGRMGYVLLAANPRATYVVFDLPESLLVSSEYLPRKLAGASVMSYEASHAHPKLNRDTLGSARCVFLGAHDLARLEPGTLDVVINIASFQEMTADQLGKYFAVIDDKLQGTLYTLQLWKASTHGFDVGEVAGYESYPFPAHWNRRYVRNASWSDLYFETAFRVGP